MLKSRAIASARVAVDRFDVIASILDLEPKESWTLWEDSEGNRLRIAKNRSVHVYPAKIPKQVTKDVYRKAHPATIAKKSYWALALFDKNKKSIFAFVGHDGTLRASYFENKRWIINISPVLLGIQILRSVSSGYIDEEPRTFSNLKVKYPKDFDIETAWSTGFPSPNTTLQENIICHLKT